MVRVKASKKKASLPAWETFTSHRKQFNTANSNECDTSLDWTPFEQQDNSFENDFANQEECSDHAYLLAAPASSEIETGALHVMPAQRNDEDPFRIQEMFDTQEECQHDNAFENGDAFREEFSDNVHLQAAPASSGIETGALTTSLRNEDHFSELIDTQQECSPSGNTASFEDPFVADFGIMDEPGNVSDHSFASSQSQPYNNDDTVFETIKKEDSTNDSSAEGSSDKLLPLAHAGEHRHEEDDLDARINSSLLDTDSESETDDEEGSKDDGVQIDLHSDLDNQESPLRASPLSRFVPGTSKDDKLRRKKVVIKDDPTVWFFEQSDEEQRYLSEKKQDRVVESYSNQVDCREKETYWGKKMRYFENRIESWTKSVAKVADAFEMRDGLQFCTSPTSQALKVPTRYPTKSILRKSGHYKRRGQRRPPRNLSRASTKDKSVKNLEALRKQFSESSPLADDPPTPPTAKQKAHDKDSAIVMKSPKSAESPMKKNPSSFLERKKNVVAATKRWLVLQRNPPLPHQTTEAPEATSRSVQKLQHPILDDETLSARFGHKLDQPVLDESSPFAFSPLGMQIAGEKSPDVSFDEHVEREFSSPTSVADTVGVQRTSRGKKPIDNPRFSNETVLRK